MNNIAKTVLLGALALSGLEGCGDRMSTKKLCEYEADEHRGHNNGEWAHGLKRSTRCQDNSQKELKDKCDALIKSTQQKVMELCMEYEVGMPVTCTETENTDGAPKFTCTEDK